MHPITRTAARANHRLKRTGHAYMLGAAVLVGLIGGYGAISFRWLIHTVQDLAWSDVPFTHEGLATVSWWWFLLIPAVGGAIAGFVTQRFAPEAGGHGVPEVMAAVALRGGRIRMRVLFAKLFASVATLASGGSVGREGPIVQIGASVGSTCGQFLGLSPRKLRTLVGCGAAAGISATFNAPVAGALFAVEVLLGDFGVPQFSPIVVSSVIAAVVARHHLGNTPTFEIPEHSLHHPVELVAYVALGVVVALAAVAFVRTLDWAERKAEHSPLPLGLQAALGGAAVGALALAMPGVLGVGYEEINRALTGQSTAGYLLILLAAKLVAVCITLASGGSGGVFAPSLFLGAAAGGVVGHVAQSILGVSIAEPGAYALVGMGAMVAATTHAPVTAILVIFELTNDYRIILPLMLSCIVGTVLASTLCRDSIYTSKLARRGLRIRGGRDVGILSSVRAGSVLRPDVATVAPGDRLGDVLQRLLGEPSGLVYVVGPEREYEGVISLHDVRPVLRDSAGLADVVVARDLAGRRGPEARPDDTLDTVLERLAAGYRDAIPVVEDGRLLGDVRTEDVLGHYRRALFRRRMSGSVAVSLSHAERDPVTHRFGTFAVEERPAPKAFVGRSIRALDVRRNYGLTILLVREGTVEDDAAPEIPDPDHVIRAEDRLVVFGRSEDVERLSEAAVRAVE